MSDRKKEKKKRGEKVKGKKKQQQKYQFRRASPAIPAIFFSPLFIMLYQHYILYGHGRPPVLFPPSYRRGPAIVFDGENTTVDDVRSVSVSNSHARKTNKDPSSDSVEQMHVGHRRLLTR